MRVKQLLVSPDPSVISALGLFFEVDVFVQRSFARERNAVNSLERVVLRVTQPVGRRILHDFEGFDDLGGWNVGARAQINQVSTLVCSHFAALSNFVTDQRHLEGIVPKQFKSLFFRQNKARELLRVRDHFLRCIFDCFVVFFVENLKKSGRDY